MTATTSPLMLDANDESSRREDKKADLAGEHGPIGPGRETYTPSRAKKIAPEKCKRNKHQRPELRAPRANNDDDFLDAVVDGWNCSDDMRQWTRCR